MTDETKTQVDDMKDFAHQAALEVKKQGRSAKDAAIRKAGEIAYEHGYRPSVSQAIHGATTLASDKIDNARDLGKQVKLEVDKKARGVVTDVRTSEIGTKAGDASLRAQIGAHNLKEKAIEAVKPEVKVVERESFRGIDITHAENPLNDHLLQKEKEEAILAAKAEEREKEMRRREALAAAKEKANEISETVAKGAKTVASALSTAAEKTGLALGSAALAVRESIEAEQPTETMTTQKRSEKGIDISSVANARNEEIQKEEEKIAAAARATSSSSTAAAKEDKPGVIDRLVNNYKAANPPLPVQHPKMSERGVDISAVSNGSNISLAYADEQAKLRRQEEEEARKKAEIQTKVVEPLKQSAAETATSVKEAFVDLGTKVQAAANKAGAVIADKVDSTLNPLEVNVRESRSASGVDTTSIENAHNNEIGEAYKARHSGINAVLPESLKTASPAQTAHHSHSSIPSIPVASTAAKEAVKPKDTETKVIKTTLDAGVATADTAAAAKTKTATAATTTSEGTSDLLHNTTVQAKDALETVKQDVAQVKEKVKEKLDEVAPTGRPNLF